MGRIVMQDDLIDREFVRRWTKWREFMTEERANPAAGFEDFLACLKEVDAAFTPEFAERESGIPTAQIVEVAREIGNAGTACATPVWRSATSGNLGGWQVTRA